MSTHVRHDHELLLESLVNGKLPRSLAWHEVLELISHIGEVLPHGGDDFTFIVDGKHLKFKRPHHDELDMEETSRLRKFLRESRQSGTSPASIGKRLIFVIDHHVAHIYQNPGIGAPETEESVKPYDPFNFHHHLIHRKESHYVGERIPEENSYYEEVAAELVSAEEIVLIGHAKGKSSAMEFLIDFLKKHHPDVFKRVVTTESLDLSALTEPQIEAIVRERLSRS